MTLVKLREAIEDYHSGVQVPLEWYDHRAHAIADAFADSSPIDRERLEGILESNEKKTVYRFGRLKCSVRDIPGGPWFDWYLDDVRCNPTPQTIGDLMHLLWQLTREKKQ